MKASKELGVAVPEQVRGQYRVDAGEDEENEEGVGDRDQRRRDGLDKVPDETQKE